MAHGDDLAAQAAALQQTIGRFSHDVGALEKRLGVAQDKLNREVKRNRRIMWGLIVSFALDIVLTGAFAFNAYRIDALQQRTSGEVLCPLYGLFLDSYHPERQPPERLAEYEASFAVLRKSYEVLDCG